MDRDKLACSEITLEELPPESPEALRKLMFHTSLILLARATNPRITAKASKEYATAGNDLAQTYLDTAGYEPPTDPPARDSAITELRDMFEAASPEDRDAISAAVIEAKGEPLQ